MKGGWRMEDAGMEDGWVEERGGYQIVHSIRVVRDPDPTYSSQGRDLPSFLDSVQCGVCFPSLRHIRQNSVPLEWTE